MPPLRQCLNSADPGVRLHAMRVIDEYTRALNLWVNPKSNDRGQGDDAKGGVDQSVRRTLARDEWCDLIDTLLSTRLKDGNASVRSSACDCVANIDATVFGDLPRNFQVGVWHGANARVRLDFVFFLFIYLLDRGVGGRCFARTCQPSFIGTPLYLATTCSFP